MNGESNQMAAGKQSETQSINHSISQKRINLIERQDRSELRYSLSVKRVIYFLLLLNNHNHGQAG